MLSGRTAPKYSDLVGILHILYGQQCEPGHDSMRVIMFRAAGRRLYVLGGTVILSTNCYYISMCSLRWCCCRRRRGIIDLILCQNQSSSVVAAVVWRINLAHQCIRLEQFVGQLSKGATRRPLQVFHVLTTYIYHGSISCTVEMPLHQSHTLP